MAHYSYYQNSHPNWGTSRYQFVDPPAPTFQPQPSWGGADYFRAHAGIADNTLFDYAWFKVKNMVLGASVSRNKAAHWWKRIYSGLVDPSALLPREIGAAAGHEAIRCWERYASIYAQPLSADREREREALIGLATAEAAKLWSYTRRPADKYGRLEASEVAAATACRIFVQSYDYVSPYEPYARFPRARRRSFSGVSGPGTRYGSGVLGDEYLDDDMDDDMLDAPADIVDPYADDLDLDGGLYPRSRRRSRLGLGTRRSSSIGVAAPGVAGMGEAAGTAAGGLGGGLGAGTAAGGLGGTSGGALGAGMGVDPYGRSLPPMAPGGAGAGLGGAGAGIGAATGMGGRLGARTYNDPPSSMALGGTGAGAAAGTGVGVGMGASTGGVGGGMTGGTGAGMGAGTGAGSSVGLSSSVVYDPVLGPGIPGTYYPNASGAMTTGANSTAGYAYPRASTPGAYPAGAGGAGGYGMNGTIGAGMGAGAGAGAPSMNGRYSGANVGLPPPPMPTATAGQYLAASTANAKGPARRLGFRRRRSHSVGAYGAAAPALGGH